MRTRGGGLNERSNQERSASNRTDGPGRSSGTISDELRRNRLRKKIHTATGTAKSIPAAEAFQAPMLESRNGSRIEKVRDGEISKTISHRRRSQDDSRMSKQVFNAASTKAIYKFVHSPHGRKDRKPPVLEGREETRWPEAWCDGKVSIDGRIMIDKRPKKVEKRKGIRPF